MMQDKTYLAALMEAPDRVEHDLSMAMQTEEMQKKLHKYIRHLKAIWHNVQRWARALSMRDAAHLLYIWKPATCKALLGKRYYAVAAYRRKRDHLCKQRSSRRLAVQRKRKAAGLDVWGKERKDR